MGDWLQPLLDWVAQNPHWAGAAVFLVSFSESMAIVGLLIPGVAMMFVAGALIAADALDFWPIFAWAVTGAVAGDGTRALETLATVRADGTFEWGRGT